MPPTVEWLRRLTWSGFAAALILALLGLLVGESVAQQRALTRALNDMDRRIAGALIWTSDRADLRVEVRSLEAEGAPRRDMLFDPAERAQAESILRSICGGAGTDLRSVTFEAPILDEHLHRWPVQVVVVGPVTALPALADMLTRRQRRLSLLTSVDVELESFFTEQAVMTLTWDYFAAAPVTPVSGAVLDPFLLPPATRLLLDGPDAPTESESWTELRSRAKELESLWEDLLDYEELLRRRAHHRTTAGALEHAKKGADKRVRALPFALAEVSARVKRSPMGAVRMSFDADGKPVWNERNALPR